MKQMFILGRLFWYKRLITTFYRFMDSPDIHPKKSKLLNTFTAGRSVA